MKAPDLPRPLRAPQANSAEDQTTIQKQEVAPVGGTKVTPGLTPPVGRMYAEPFVSGATPKLSGEKVSVTFDGISLPT